jgi:hypothetical protein
LIAQTQPSGTGTGSFTGCAGTFTDDGGGGNYANNCNSVFTICPSTPGTYVTVTFTAFNCENGNDVLYVFDGSTGGALLGSLTGTTIPAAITSSDPSGCLVFHFVSNGSTRRAGWDATISCSATPGAGGSNASTDCNGGGGATVCGNATISGNSSGAGSAELSSTWDGCLTGEHQSSWYYFSPSASGTVEFTLAPTNGTDDYDFAIWGPSTSGNPCPFATGQAPVRCSYAAASGSANTGLNSSATGQNSEGSGGDGFVAPLPVVAGQIYVMLIDNFSSSSNPFTLTWNLTGGASLDCTLLPIELLYFKANCNGEKVDLFWSTASELNNDFFTIERSKDAIHWETVLTVDGAGNSNQVIEYKDQDLAPLKGTPYYRLKQTDFDGQFAYSNVEVVKNFDANGDLTIFPNPTNGNNFSLELSGFGEEEVLIVIRDITGKEFYSKTYVVKDGNELIAFPITETIPKGTYIVTATNNDKLVAKRLVVQ